MVEQERKKERKNEMERPNPQSHMETSPSSSMSQVPPMSPISQASIPPLSQSSPLPQTAPMSPSALSSPPLSPQSCHCLNATWVLWFHDLNNEKWDLSSYEQIFSFNTIEDFWVLYNNMTNLYNGMFYLMRQNYPPIWDHPLTMGGAGWTFRVDKRHAPEFWEKISCYCVGETLCENSESIKGVSISPKIKNVTIRIWTDNLNTNPQQFEITKKETAGDEVVIDFTEARFQLNIDALK